MNKKEVYQIVVSNSYHNTNLFLGTEEDIKYYANLMYKDPKIIKCQDQERLLSNKNVRNIIKEYNEAKCSGDIIKYNGKIYKVLGFNNDKIALISLENNGEKEIYINMNEDYKMIKNKFYNRNITFNNIEIEERSIM